MSNKVAVPGLNATLHISTTAGLVPAVASVNPTTGAAVATESRGSGAVDANTTRVTLATDSPAVRTADTVLDSTGQPFSPDACAHTYGYSAGLLVTDTATDGTSTWVKTYSYTSGNLTGETKWVKQ